MLYGKGDTGLGKKLIHLAINSITFKYQREENILIKNIFEVLVAPLIHFPPAAVPGTKNINKYKSSPAGRALEWGLERRGRRM